MLLERHHPARHALPLGSAAALQDEGGWLNPRHRAALHRLCGRWERRLGDRVAAIATHNGPGAPFPATTAASSHRAEGSATVQVAHHLLLSGRQRAMRAAAEGRPSCSTSRRPTWRPACRATDPPRRARVPRCSCDCRTRSSSRRYPTASGVHLYPQIRENDFDLIAQPLDFLGVNYYAHLGLGGRAADTATRRLARRTWAGRSIPRACRAAVGLHATMRCRRSTSPRTAGLPDRLVDGRAMRRASPTCAAIAALSRAIAAGVDASAASLEPARQLRVGPSATTSASAGASTTRRSSARPGQRTGTAGCRRAGRCAPLT